MAERYFLKCRECGAEYPDQEQIVCDDCFGPLRVEFRLEEVGKTLGKKEIASRPLDLWRYKELLPVEGGKRLLHAGWTPLFKAEKLGDALGLKDLWIKNDAVNPTYSFKDRPVATGIAKAIEFGKTVVSCASTGNLAASVAAYAARAGLKSVVFIPLGIEANKVAQMMAYGAKVIAVRGNYDTANRLSNEAADRLGFAVLNVNVRPWYAEGEKTLLFETAEQLGWQLPDSVIVPMGSGGLLCEVEKACRELQGLGFVDEKTVRYFGAQGAGCSPIIDALKSGGKIVPLKEPRTLAKSIAMGAPGDGVHSLKILRQSGGGESASDAEILAGIELLARTEGILTEPAGGTTIAALKKLAESGKLDSDERIVAFITGNGLKTQETIPTGKIVEIDAKIEEVERVVG